MGPLKENFGRPLIIPVETVGIEPGSKYHEEAITRKAGHNMEMDVPDFLPGSLPIGQVKVTPSQRRSLRLSF